MKSLCSLRDGVNMEKHDEEENVQIILGKVEWTKYVN